MNPTQGSFWDRTQLALLRLLTMLLALFDRLFNVRWGEHLLDRMANRWQAQLAQLDRSLARLEEERHRLQLQVEALAIHAATIYLGGRKLTHDELRFDPDLSHEEEILDASIDLLVKQRLATIETKEVEPGHFVYILEPDWAAIHSRLSAAAAQAEPEIAEWFREGLRFIEERLLVDTASQTQASPMNPHLE